MIRRMVCGFCALAVVLALSSLGLSQTVTARLSGVLTDESGGVLPGAQVTIKNVETGVQRTVATDARGHYVAPTLAPGEYEITATAAGFETLAQKGIGLAVGQAAEINLKMKVGAVTSLVEVTGEAPLVDTSTSAVAGVVDEERILDLPLNGRDFSQLALVQPGVVALRNTDQRSTKGFGTRMSMAGSRPEQTAWLLDGTNITGAGSFGTPGSAAGVMLGVDAIREFQVLITDYSAEFGHTSGGVVNMVTKSGTNGLHGSLYEFLRNSDLDARNFFDQTKPAFKRNQFGFSLGGPIKKDKAFFFGNYEGLRQRLGLSNVAVVPDANAHKGLIPGSRGSLQQVQVAPEIRPYLDLWPLPNGSSLGDGLAELFAPAKDSVGENYLVTRVDYHISDSQSIFSRFTLDQTTDSRPDVIPLENLLTSSPARYSAVEYEKIFSPQLLSISRVSYNRSRIASSLALNVTYPSSLFFFIPGFPANFSLPGATTLGPAAQSLFHYPHNVYEFSQSFVYTRSRQSFKFGFDFEHLGSPMLGNSDPGSFGWDSLSAFLTDDTMSDFSIAVPGGTTDRTFVQKIFGAYIQDDWKLRPNLTLNLGLRYEPYTTPAEQRGRVSVVKDWVHATAFDVGVPYWQNPSKKNLSPRAGLSWDPKGDGKTAIRGGFGIFFADLLDYYYRSNMAKNPPFAAYVESPLGNLATVIPDVTKIAPSLLSPIMTPDSGIDAIQYNIKNPSEMKFNLTIQRQLPRDISLSVGYVGDRGFHGMRAAEANDAPSTLVNGRPFIAKGTPRLNPNMGVGSIRYTDSQTFYNALQVEVKKRLSRGFQFQGSYTWSKTIDDSTISIGSDFIGQTNTTANSYYPKSDRGLSPLHVGQNLVANGTYAFPVPVRSGLTSGLLGGWQLSSILTVSSGTPFSARVSGRNAPDLSNTSGNQRPDLVSGRSFSSMILGGPDKYFDSSAFVLPPPGFYGNSGRNVLIGPGFASVDLSVIKTTRLHITEASRLEFRGDFFNLANRANFAVPSSVQVFNASTRVPISSAGKITKTVSTSRQLQFGLKVIF